MSSTCPYTPGNEIVVTLPGSRMGKAKIVDLKTFTFSCVMVVRFQSSSSQDLRLLKLYDRRFAEQLRRDEGAAPWDMQIERRYHELVRTGDPSKLFSRWSAGFRGDQYWQDNQREQWSQAELEAYLQFLCQKACDTEKHAYKLMRDMQGIHVPRFHEEVILHSSQISAINTSTLGEYLDCPGILLQYIRGFPLTDLADNVARGYWQRICEGAIEIIHQIGDRGICNKDVKTRSFILQAEVDSSTPRLFMVDFGLCVFLDQAEDKREFREWQADQDEEGAIGCVMERKLKGGYEYHRSERSERLLDEFKSEDCEEGA